MSLTPEELKFLKDVFQNSQVSPLEPGDPRYEPLYAAMGPSDPV